MLPHWFCGFKFTVLRKTAAELRLESYSVAGGKEEEEEEETSLSPSGRRSEKTQSFSNGTNCCDKTRGNTYGRNNRF